MKKKLLLLFIVLSALTISIGARESYAQAKYGYVDSQDVADEHPIYKEKIQEIEKVMKPQKEKIQAKQKELEELNKKINENQLASDDVRNAQKTNLQKKGEEYQQMVAGFQSEVQKKEAEILPDELKKKILEEVMSAIQIIAKREGFQIVYEIQKANIVYIEPSLDLTERAKSELIGSLTKKK